MTETEKAYREHEAFPAFAEYANENGISLEYFDDWETFFLLFCSGADWALNKRV